MSIAGTMGQLRHLGKRAWAAIPIGGDHLCCICGQRVRRFLPYRGSWSDMPQVLTEAGVIGSDIANFECPICGCHDRERHLFLFLKASGLFRQLTGASILHLAPETHLQALIAKAAPREYILGDLHPSSPRVRRIDLMAIDCPADSVDFVIANHVLEHVRDDAQALREILRVLRPGGNAILQTPFASRRTSKIEDAGLSTEAERLQAYGQEDHCRLYGADFPGFVASFGFDSAVATHDSLLPDIDARLMGVNAQEPFLLFIKPGR